MVVMHYRAYESLRYGYPYVVDLKLCFDIRTLHNYFIWLYGLPHVGFVFFFRRAFYALGMSYGASVLQ